MGCWFDLAIEALFDGKWVVIVKMGDGTSSGGYPLTDAMWSLLKFHGIRGAYGIEFPYEHNPPVLWRDTTVVASKSSVAGKDEEADPETGDDSDSSQNQGGGSDNDDSEEARSPRPRVSSDPWEVAYYSSEHVSLLAERCGPTVSRVNRSARTYQQKEYLGLMPAWMDLARYAYPYEEFSCRVPPIPKAQVNVLLNVDKPTPSTCSEAKQRHPNLHWSGYLTAPVTCTAITRRPFLLLPSRWHH
jgi:hypothetical protein